MIVSDYEYVPTCTLPNIKEKINSFGMDISKFVRKPLVRPDLLYNQSFFVCKSPNKEFKIVFSHFSEVRMMVEEGLFTLVDHNDAVIDNFEPLVAIRSNVLAWSSDSSYFALPIRFTDYGFLIVRLPGRDFTFLKFENPYPLEIAIQNEALAVSYNEQQVALSNSNQVVGGGSLEIPKKLYRKPADLQFKLDSLIYHPRESLSKGQVLFEKDGSHELKLIDEGYSVFKGEFPRTTSSVYNNRQLEVYQLEAFAGYGDDPSQIWLEEIKRKTNNNYNRWNKVSDYLGYLIRSKGV